MMKKLTAAMLALLLVLSLIGCSGNDDDPAPDTDQQTRNLSAIKPYAYVGMGEGLSYSAAEADGFREACTELGLEAIIRQPSLPTGEEQKKLVDELLQEDIGGIVISGNDQQALASAVEAAKAKGLPIVAVDLYLSGASMWVSALDAEKAGTLLADAALDLCGGEGEFAILTGPLAEQNGWTAALENALKDNKYAGLTLSATVNGMDDANRSEMAVSELLRDHPTIKCIIAPAPEGLAAAAKVARKERPAVKVSGFGLPSSMQEHLKNGTCPYMYMWNPKELGYASAYTAYMLASGRMKGETGEALTANRLGEFTVKEAQQGGKEIGLGTIFKFEEANVGDWVDLF